MPTVLITGLDGAGKTKLMYTLKLGQVTEADYRAVEFDPTVAFNYEILPWQYKRTLLHFKCWDLAGRPHLRRMWRSFYEAAPPDVLLFVVDEKHQQRMDEAKFEFTQLVHDASLQRTLFVVVVNVRDEADTVPTDLRDAEDRVRAGLMSSSASPQQRPVKVFAVRLGKDLATRNAGGRRGEDGAQSHLNNVFNYISHQLLLQHARSSSSQRV